MNYTDTQLKQALAKMLPEEVKFNHEGTFVWTGQRGVIFNTELLHLCWLVETPFTEKEVNAYIAALKETNFHWFPHVAWQQRVIALAKVKGVEL